MNPLTPATENGADALVIDEGEIRFVAFAPRARFAPYFPPARRINLGKAHVALRRKRDLGEVKAVGAGADLQAATTGGGAATSNNRVKLDHVVGATYG